jgi:hypothetical protein
MRRINWRISWLIFGRPGRRNLDRNRQNSREPERCQDTTVSGFTMISASVQSEHSRVSTIQKLPKCDRFQSEFVARHEERADVSDHRESERNHQSDLS